jgi:gamma-glutamyltranspeptidase/glutathione hydrolase
MELADLAAHESAFSDAISVGYRDCRVWQHPPNGGGLVPLIALGILDGDPRFEGLAYDDPLRSHLLIEAVRLAYADGRAQIADPATMQCSVAQLLDPAYLASRRAEISMEAATADVQTGQLLAGSDTVSF